MSSSNNQGQNDQRMQFRSEDDDVTGVGSNFLRNDNNNDTTNQSNQNNPMNNLNNQRGQYNDPRFPGQVSPGNKDNNNRRYDNDHALDHFSDINNFNQNSKMQGNNQSRDIKPGNNNPSEKKDDTFSIFSQNNNNVAFNKNENTNEPNREIQNIIPNETLEASQNNFNLLNENNNNNNNNMPGFPFGQNSSSNPKIDDINRPPNDSINNELDRNIFSNNENQENKEEENKNIMSMPQQSGQNNNLNPMNMPQQNQGFNNNPMSMPPNQNSEEDQKALSMPPNRNGEEDPNALSMPQNQNKGLDNNPNNNPMSMPLNQNNDLNQNPFKMPNPAPGQNPMNNNNDNKNDISNNFSQPNNPNDFRNPNVSNPFSLNNINMNNNNEVNKNNNANNIESNAVLNAMNNNNQMNMNIMSNLNNNNEINNPMSFPNPNMNENAMDKMQMSNQIINNQMENLNNQISHGNQFNMNSNQVNQFSNNPFANDKNQNMGQNFNQNPDNQNMNQNFNQNPNNQNNNQINPNPAQNVINPNPIQNPKPIQGQNPNFNQLQNPAAFPPQIQPQNNVPFTFSRYKKAAKTGLKNLGDTSYLNSVLQLLGTVRELARYFVNPKNEKFFVDNINNASLSFVIYRLFTHFYPYPEENQRQIYSLDTLFQVLGNINQVYNSKKRRNPNDRIFFLLNFIHREINLKKTKYLTNMNHTDKEQVTKISFEDFLKSNESIISTNFFWFELKTQRCSGCNKDLYYFNSYETFELDLAYCLSQRNNNNPLTIATCLQFQSYKNQKSFCELCNSYHQMNINNKIYYSPNYFVFSLSREGNSNLLNIPFYLEYNIDIDPFLEAKQSFKKYELHAVVSLNRNNNKYVCFGQSPVDKQWYLYDDENVDNIDINNVFDLHNNKWAYIPCILLYKSTGK